MLAWGLLRLVLGIAPNGIPHLEQASLDLRVLLFALAGSLVSGLLFGLAPAFQSQTMSTRRTLLRESLVALQIAVSLVLMTGAGMLLRSLWKLESVPLGLDAQHVITAEFLLGRQRYSQDASQLQFYDDLETRMRRIPGVTALAISDSLPPYGGTRGHPFASLRVEDRPPFAEGTGGMVSWRYVTPEYFATLGIPIIRGRGFTERDRGPGDDLAVVSESLARKLFPDGDAVGKRMRMVNWYVIAGVARDVKNNGAIEPPGLEYYVLRKHSTEGVFRSRMAPDGWRSGKLLLRTSLDPKPMSDWMAREFAALDPQLPVTIATMQQRVSKMAQRPRFNALLLTLFAGIGVMLAAIGLYGVMAFLVGQRIPEIGIRMAIGATPATITKLILSRAALWTLAGALAGFAGSFVAASALRTLLFQVPEHDPWTFALALPVLLLISLPAAWIPSRKAASTDPLVALRHD
jgi:predicted permease